MAAYVDPDGDLLVPGPLARGPWGDDTVNGRVVGALLARGLEGVLAAEGFRGARLTVDLSRMLRLRPCRVTATVDRAGGRLRAGSAVVWQDDAVVATARGLFARVGEEPPGEVYSQRWEVPPVPAEKPGPSGSVRLTAFGPGDGADDRMAGWRGTSGPKGVWAYEDRQLVAGEEMSPFVRAGIVGDLASPMTNWSSAGLRHINTDYTVGLARLPEGPDVGLLAVNRVSADGISTVYAAMYDHRGQVGGVVATAIANDALPAG